MFSGKYQMLAWFDLNRRIELNWLSYENLPLQIGYSGKKLFGFCSWFCFFLWSNKEKGWNYSLLAWELLLHSLARQHQDYQCISKEHFWSTASLSGPQGDCRGDEARKVWQIRQGEVEGQMWAHSFSDFWCALLFCSWGCRKFPTPLPKPSFEPQFDEVNLWLWPKHWSRRQKFCIQLPATRSLGDHVQVTTGWLNLPVLQLLSTGWK